MWTYSQSTGQMRRPGGILYCFCYSGAGEAKNSHAMQTVRNVGPIPVGKYRMIEWRDHDPHMGLGVIVLQADPGNEMFGRAGMCWHGDNATHTASHGCIIGGNAATRKQAWDSGDRDIEVVI